MKKIYESTLNGWDESAEKIYVYALENEEEFWDFHCMTHEERCEYFGVVDETDYFVRPGAMYQTYSFNLSGTHMIMRERVAYNV